MVAQGELWWAHLAAPKGSEAGYRRPVLVVQGDAFNRSRIRTVVCVPLTTNLRLADLPGNVLFPAGTGGLRTDSVANSSLIFAVDRAQLRERIGRVARAQVEMVFRGIDEVLGRAA